MGSFKHFIEAVTLIERTELGRVRSLAVCEGLFVGLGSNVTASCLRQFWGQVWLKFTGVEEVFVVVGKERQERVKVEVEGQVKGERNGDGERGLAWQIGRAVEGVERERGWRAPRWKIVVLAEELGTGDGMIRQVERGVVEESAIALDATGLYDALRDALF